MNFRPTLAPLILAGLIAASVPHAALAAAVGGPQGTARIGQPLLLRLPLVLRDGEELPPACVRIVPPQGTDAPPAAGARATLEERQVLVRTTQPVLEPAVRIAVQVGCDNPIVREFVILLDPPSARDSFEVSLPQSPQVAAPVLAKPATSAATAKGRKGAARAAAAESAKSGKAGKSETPMAEKPAGKSTEKQARKSKNKQRASSAEAPAPRPAKSAGTTGDRLKLAPAGGGRALSSELRTSTNLSQLPAEGAPRDPEQTRRLALEQAKLAAILRDEDPYAAVLAKEKELAAKLSAIDTQLAQARQQMAKSDAKAGAPTAPGTSSAAPAGSTATSPASTPAAAPGAPAAPVTDTSANPPAAPVSAPAPAPTAAVPAKAEAPRSAAADESSGWLTWLLWGVAAVAGLIGLSVLVQGWRRRRETEEAPWWRAESEALAAAARPQATPPVVPAARPVATPVAAPAANAEAGEAASDAASSPAGSTTKAMGSQFFETSTFELTDAQAKAVLAKMEVQELERHSTLDEAAFKAAEALAATEAAAQRAAQLAAQSAAEAATEAAAEAALQADVEPAPAPSAPAAGTIDFALPPVPTTPPVEEHDHGADTQEAGMTFDPERTVEITPHKTFPFNQPRRDPLPPVAAPDERFENEGPSTVPLSDMAATEASESLAAGAPIDFAFDDLVPSLKPPSLPPEPQDDGANTAGQLQAAADAGDPLDFDVSLPSVDFDMSVPDKPVSGKKPS